jgi:hypothetical protein
MPELQEYLGFVEFTGEGVDDGLLDARKQASALIGFDSSIRYFVGRQIPDLQNADYKSQSAFRKAHSGPSPQLLNSGCDSSWCWNHCVYNSGGNQMAQNDFKTWG